ncbi:MAG TPA: NHL repeat-containing protein [Chthoniobacterales bacterium]|nr:NHL repeat-containing protein [Chthoniobacterales bacterium]
MLALIYLGLAFYLGDQFCRRFFRFVSVAHRCAAAVLVGLLFSSWFTYVLGWLFARSKRPLFWADLCFFAVALGAIWIFRRRSRRRWGPYGEFIQPKPPGRALWDWVTLGAYLVLASWLMFATLDYKNDLLLIGNNEWSDFGPNTAIIQSFAVGHNFPTQYPHFSGETIRYHFLFYFQAGNLSYLGLNLAWSLNLLSILTQVCMLALVMALGQLLFNSRAVGRIGSALFYFHGTLSFLAFLRAQPSVSAAFNSILTLKDFLPSGYPYRGELWGIWTQVVFLNQRHLASGVGILLLVLIFLVDRYRRHAAARAEAVAQPPADEPAPAPAPEIAPVATEASNPPAESEAIVLSPEPVSVPESSPPPKRSFASRMREIAGNIIVFNKGFVFCGLLLGCLPFWNAMVFTSSFAILSLLFLFFPCRRQMLGLGLMTAVAALPQLYMLRSGVKTATRSILHWGYIVDPPTINNVLRYIGFSFGLKWFLVLIALACVTWFQRRLFLALCSMFLVTFCLELSLETLANHKFLNLWLIVGNLYVAYGLWRIWHIRPRWLIPLGRLAALALAAAIFVGGAIDLFPIHNSYFIQLKYGNDPLVKWIWANTKPHDVFLSDRFVNHQILLAGRRLFYGWPSFSWGAGYDTTKRDHVYRTLFESQDPYTVFRLLRENNIVYVAIDEGVRRGEFIKRPNEDVYSLNFQKVWEDKANAYSKLVIYKVPETPSPQGLKRPDPARAQARLMEIPAVTMFQGGKGAARGQFDFPRGMTADRAGNILVADTSNGRIQKFSPAGVFLSLFGKTGKGEGELQEPNGLAVDASGNIYVGDVGNQRIQKFTGSGRFISQWRPPAPGFYGPRDLCVTSDNFVYVVDQGHARIVKFDANGVFVTTWGTQGQSDGQFVEPAAVAVSEKNQRVYVADPRNKRIQVFDPGGKFIAKWPVPEWQTTSWIFHHLLIDQEADRLYATSPTTDEVLIFDLDGKRIGELKAKPPDKLEGASALALANGKLYVLCTFADRVRLIDLRAK